MLSGSRRADIDVIMRVIEYIVQDCPIMGRVVARHYIEEVKEYGKCR